MSHQTGIKASDELKQVFADCREKDYRVVKVGIDIGEEKLISLGHQGATGTWEQDYDALIPPLIEEKEPCYLFYRFDEKDSQSKYRWLFIVYVPEYATVKQKMIYAATKSSLKTTFGSGQIQNEILETSITEMNYKGYISHIEHQEAPAPLTASEEEQKQMREEEGPTESGSTTKQSHLKGIAFPVRPDAKDKLLALKNGDYTYVRLCVDIKNEEILLDDSDSIELNALPAKVPTDKASYHVFTFKHTHEGDYLESNVFIYSMPGYNCPVKERMLYTSCLSPLIGFLGESLGIEIAKRIEISDGAVLTEAFLMDEVHPVRNLHRPAFAKPKGPPGKRGQRRLLKEEN
ncbi:twinfilin-1-like [Asterias amurensis]|uniref:twinfilin-1-like n=1 Tax=Asterias amurensis TaxID=7602 RepID=UPI003AB63E9E